MEYANIIHGQMEQAMAARSAGNEGRARVCARRAAGLTARAFLKNNQVQNFESFQSATQFVGIFVSLEILANYPGFTPEIKQLVDHLTKRVGNSFHLLPGIDLLADADLLIKEMK
jgi:hypothetical protein